MRRVVSTGGSITMDREYVKLGEGDMKLPHIVAQQDDGAIVNVISADSDMLLIFMLQYLKWFPAKGSDARWTVYLDSNMPGGAYKPWIDVKEVWRQVIDKMDQRFGWVRHPLHTLCVVVIMAGNDFCKTISRRGTLANGLELIGPDTIWKAFQQKEAERYLGERDKHPLFAVEQTHDPFAPTSVNLNETKIANFIFAIYHFKVMKTWPGSSSFKNGIYDSEELRRVHASKKMGLPIPTDNDIAAFVRRISWSMYYMVNGTATRAAWFAPHACDKHGKSIWGWRFDDTTHRLCLTSDTNSAVFRSYPR